MALSFTEELEVFNQIGNYKDYEARLTPLLNKCDTQEQLDTANTAIKEVRTRLMTNNPEFHVMMDDRKRAVKTQAEYNQTIHRAEITESKHQALRIQNEALSKNQDIPLQDGVVNTRYKTYDPKEKETQLKAGQGCPNPKCRDHGKNRGNTLNDVLTCMICHHKLIPKPEFKDYNRKYWRRFNKNKDLKPKKEASTVEPGKKEDRNPI